MAWRCYLRWQERRQENEPCETTQSSARALPMRRSARTSYRVIVMSFKYSYTFPCNGPNKLPRFSQWAADNLPGIEFSLPPQVPAKSTTLTVRLKSAEDRQALIEMSEGATF